MSLMSNVISVIKDFGKSGVFKATINIYYNIYL